MSELFATSDFLNSSVSLLGSLDSVSIYTTTSSSTVPGIGALSGKFIHGFGKRILLGIEAVMILRRLSYIQSLCPLHDAYGQPSLDLEKVYDDLVELARPGLYTSYVRKTSLRIICEQIKRSETRLLIKSLKKWRTDERIAISCEILKQFPWTVDPADLSDFKMIVALYRAVLIYLPKDPDRPTLLNDFSAVLCHRFDKMGKAADIDCAVLLSREALKLRPAPHPDRSWILTYLAHHLSKRFDRMEELANLEEAVLLNREALELHPSPHPDRSWIRQILANDLSKRSDKMGMLAELEEAVHLNCETLKTQPTHNLDRSMILNNLARVLSKRFHKLGEVADLDEAVVLHLEALELRPTPHADNGTAAKEQSKTQITFGSGDPQTHPSVDSEATKFPKKIDVEMDDMFICTGAVNTTTLLRATRGCLMGAAKSVGGNALVDEQWKCTIRGPKRRSDGAFRVQIHYTANATRSDKPDPQKPVALDEAKGIPGLMTIVGRNSKPIVLHQ